jgi:DNA-binding NarL/FixJ family response regulator
LLCEVLCHREALARALHAYHDIALIGSVANVHAALILAEEQSPDVLIVDSPSDAVARTLAAHSLECEVVFIGAVGECYRQLGSGRAATFVGAGSSLDEVHAALRFAKPRHVAVTSPPCLPQSLASADSILTLRQQEVSRLVAGGYSNKEIANACGISLATVKNHVHRILGRLNFQRRTQIARLAGNPPSTMALERAEATQLGAGPTLGTPFHKR